MHVYEPPSVSLLCFLFCFFVSSKIGNKNSPRLSSLYKFHEHHQAEGRDLMDMGMLKFLFRRTSIESSLQTLEILPNTENLFAEVISLLFTKDCQSQDSNPKTTWFHSVLVPMREVMFTTFRRHRGRATWLFTRENSDWDWESPNSLAMKKQLLEFQMLPFDMLKALC